MMGLIDFLNSQRYNIEDFTDEEAGRFLKALVRNVDNLEKLVKDFNARNLEDEINTFVDAILESEELI